MTYDISAETTSVVASEPTGNGIGLPAAVPTREIDKLAAALAKAQGEMNNAPLNKINPHFKSKYADLSSIRDAVVPALAKHGIAVVQQTEFEGNRFILRTALIHSSGQYIDSTFPLPTGEKIQQLGSHLTYAKRYTLSSLCCISADEDDDGNAAQNTAKQKSATNPKPAPEPESTLMDWKAFGFTKTGAQEQWREVMRGIKAAITEVEIDGLLADNQSLIEAIMQCSDTWGDCEKNIQRARDELRQRVDVPV